MSQLLVILPPDDRFVPHEEELVLEPAVVSFPWVALEACGDRNFVRKGTHVTLFPVMKPAHLLYSKHLTQHRSNLVMPPLFSRGYNDFAIHLSVNSSVQFPKCALKLGAVLMKWLINVEGDVP